MDTDTLPIICLAVIAGVLVAGWMLGRRGASSSNDPFFVEIDRSATSNASVREAMERGNKIEAVKAYRDVTGVGLKEAKDAVEHFERERQGIQAPYNVVVKEVRHKKSEPDEPYVPLHVDVQTALTDPLLQETITHGRKIEAIKRFRQLTGLGLKDSKDAVDKLEQDIKAGRAPKTPTLADLLAPEPAPTVNPDLERQVRELLSKGRKIEAIKIYRQATGLGLKEAKDAVEGME
jgi:ribosomal protein L7/L12